jgi:hypothetical protein
MSLEVWVHQVNGHLSIKAVGPYSLVDLRDLFARAQEESEKLAEREVILDVTEVAGTIPVMDMHVLGEHCSRVWKLQFRIAIVSPDGGLNKFFENVARNRGIQVAVVPNQGAAIAWLT